MTHRMVERNRGLRFRLYPDAAQEQGLLLQGHAARALWNMLHAWWLLARKDRRANLSHADAQIRQARRDIPWLGLLPAQAAQQVLKTYFRAWQDCWAGDKSAPKFKPRRGWLSIDVPQGRDLNLTAQSRKWSTVQVPKIGVVRFRQHRAIPGAVSGARIIREPDGSWFLVLRTTQRVRAANVTKKQTQPVAGVDRGITIPVAVSNGTQCDHGSWLTTKQQERVLRLQRKTVRQRDRRRATNSRISKGERETQCLIGTLQARARRRRTNWLHQTTRELADTFSMISIEKLPIGNMTRTPAPTPDPDRPGRFLPNGRAAKAGLNKAIHAEAWGEFRTLLTYKMTDRAGIVIPVPAPHTSLTCHQCRTITAGSRESQAVFACKNPTCGWRGNADDNASRNIEIDALADLAQHDDPPARVWSSAMNKGLVLVPASGTLVAARSRYELESHTSGVEPLPGTDTGTNDSEPDQQATAPPLLVDH